MHDLLQEMGWEIIRLDSGDDLRKRSRLWRLEDIRLLEDDKVTDSVRAIFFDLSRHEVELQLNPAAFKRMTNLRFLKLCRPPWNACNNKCTKLVLKHHLEFISDELRYLHWDFYSLKSLPSNFNPRNLVELILDNCEIELLWGVDKDLLNLRVLNLSRCMNLRKITNLSKAIKLEELRCYDCEHLVELPSMEHLTSLRCLHLVHCSNLKNFPEVIPIHLNELNLSGSGIEEVPDSIGHLLQLRELRLVSSSIITISSNLSKLESLTVLSLHNCQITEFPKLPRNLSQLDLEGTRIEKVSSSIMCLHKLEALHMGKTRIRNLPSSIIELHALKVITLDDCPNITIFPIFPEKIEEINMQRSSIEEIPSSISRLKCLKKLRLEGSRRLKSLYELPPFIEEVLAYDCMSMQMVSFADPYQYTFCEQNVRHRIEFDSFKLNGEAKDNIVANALLRIHRIAEQLVEKSVHLAKEPVEKELDRKIYRISFYEEELSCFFSGSLKYLQPFEHQSKDSSIKLELDQEVCSSSLLCFVFGFLLDINLKKSLSSCNVWCKWQLKTSSGESHNFMVTAALDSTRCPGQHILFDRIMVHETMPYVEASFQFFTGDDLKVLKYGVYVFYKDADIMGRNNQLSVGDESSEIFCEEVERNNTPDNGHEPEPNEMKSTLCLSIECLQRLLQKVFSLFKSKVEQTGDT